MTEQELKEQIAKQRCYLCDFHGRDGCSKQEFSCSLARGHADEILALVKEALPELAKEAGYVKLAEDQSSAR